MVGVPVPVKNLIRFTSTNANLLVGQLRMGNMGMNMNKELKIMLLLIMQILGGIPKQGKEMVRGFFLVH